MRKIFLILDSNFLYIPFIFSIDIFTELDKLGNFTPIILSSNFEELKKLSKSKSLKKKKQALFALNLAKKCRYFQVNKRKNESYDDVIVRVAKERNWPVATNDRILRLKLRSLNIPTIYLRQKSYLEVEGYFAI
jgi:rRNA-processing protein FCF1